MAEIGGNPSRIIAVWREFVHAHPSAAQLWGSENRRIRAGPTVSLPGAAGL
jgi:hypothetical protein